MEATIQFRDTVDAVDPIDRSGKPKATRIALLNFADDFALGTRSIAAHVRKHGYRCDLVFVKRLAHNSPHYSLNEANYVAVVGLLRTLAPDVIGLSVATRVLPYALEMSRRIRAAFPGARLLWGGWHATMSPDSVFRDADVDGVAVGESEETVLEVLDRTERGASLGGVAGLRTRVADPVPQRPLVQDLDTIPWFRYDDVPSYLVEDEGVQTFDTLPPHYGPDRYGYPLISSRGCPYNCSFCSVPYLKDVYATTDGRFLRRRSVESVIEELIHARDVLGANYVWFFDEEFLFHRKWMRSFLPAYRDRVGLPWYCEAHPDSFLDEEFVRLLAESGLMDLEIGIQSASPETLKLFNRPHRTQAKLVELSRTFAQTDIAVTYDVILDNPLEKEADVRLTLDYLLSLERPFMVQMFTLAFRENYPLTRKALEAGAITEADYEAKVMLEQLAGDAGHERDVSRKAKIGEFPFVQLTYLNCLVYLTQVDGFPKAWIRAMGRSPWWERHAGILSRLVLFLERSKLAHVRYLLRRRRVRRVAENAKRIAAGQGAGQQRAARDTGRLYAAVPAAGDEARASGDARIRT